MAASKTKSKTKISALGALADAGRDLHARQPRWPNPDRLVRVGLVEVLMSQRRLPRTSGDVDIYEALERQGLVERQGGKLAFVATALGRSIPLSAFSAQDRQSASEGIEDVGYARGSKHARLAARPKHSSARAGRASGLRGPKQPNWTVNGDDIRDALEHAQDALGLHDIEVVFRAGEPKLMRLDDVLRYEDSTGWMELDPVDFDGLSRREKERELSRYRGAEFAARAMR